MAFFMQFNSRFTLVLLFTTITCAIFKLLIIRFFVQFIIASLTIKWVMLRREIMDGKTEQLPK